MFLPLRKCLINKKSRGESLNSQQKKWGERITSSKLHEWEMQMYSPVSIRGGSGCSSMAVWYPPDWMVQVGEHRKAIQPFRRNYHLVCTFNSWHEYWCFNLIAVLMFRQHLSHPDMFICWSGKSLLVNDSVCFVEYKSICACIRQGELYSKQE